MLPIIAYVNIIRSERSITRSYQSFKVTTVTKHVLLTVLGIAGDTTKILLGYKINPSCFLVKVTCSHKSMSISIIWRYSNCILLSKWRYSNCIFQRVWNRQTKQGHARRGQLPTNMDALILVKTGSYWTVVWLSFKENIVKIFASKNNKTGVAFWTMNMAAIGRVVTMSVIWPGMMQLL